jgi:hypothetical protein
MPYAFMLAQLPLKMLVIWGNYIPVSFEISQNLDSTAYLNLSPQAIGR